VVAFLVATISPVQAMSVAQQTTDYSSSLNVWEAIQEVGSNLSGTAQSITFRVSTDASNIDQFDFTALNSRIIDKDNNNLQVISCVNNASDRLNNLQFSSTGVPAGYEDVIIDFSCRNYSFISGHKYLISISNANAAQFGGSRMHLASAAYSGTSNDYFPGGGLRYAFDNGFCSATNYVYNSQSSNNGCNIFSTAKDDLYFVLNNTAPPPPPPRLPVVFIPGIGGSEMKASQDIIWSKDDGHNGTFSHGYTNNEKIWVNQDEAIKLGDDDYFDILRLKPDGVTPEATLSLTGNLTSFGYSDIDPFFSGMGYNKGTNYFVFNYDWRKDVRGNQTDLDNLIESAKTASGQSKVNLVVHSMGGLIARNYIADSAKAAKVNKLIELGVPHLGTTYALKTLIYGTWLARDLYIIKLGIVPSEIKDVFQNLPSAFQLLPSNKYFSFYNNSDNDHPYPFRDDRDIDNNNVTGVLNYNQIKGLLSNLGFNMTVFNLGEQFHSLIDPNYNQTNNVKIYEIVGSSQPTLGQIFETWWITWPINLIPKTDEIYVNGDDTVPLLSGSLKSDSQDLSGAYKIYYVDQHHPDLVSQNGAAMQTVKSILNDDNALPVEVKDQKISLEGDQLSLDDGNLDLYDDQGRHCGLNDKGEIEENIPDVTCTTSGNTKQAFIKKKAAKIKVKVTRKTPVTKSKTTNIKIRVYKTDKISKTTIYKDLPVTTVGEIDFNLDPTTDTSPPLTLYPDASKPDNTTITSTSEITGDTAVDQTAPTTTITISGTKDSSGLYTGPVTITLTGKDTGAGILKIEYSLDNGQTVQTYSGPITISTPGKTTIQVKSTDNVGNEEVPQTITVEIAVPPTPTPTPSPTTTPTPASTTSASGGTSSNSDSSSSNSSNSPTTTATSVNDVIARSEATKQSPNLISQPSVLGISLKNPDQISDLLNNIAMKPLNNSSTLNGLLIATGGLGSLAMVILLMSFIPARVVVSRKTKHSFVKPFPK